MRNLFGILFVLFSFVGLSGQSFEDCTTIQDEVYRYVNETDEAKVCHAVVVCKDAVQFYLSQTSIRTFYRLNGSVWVDHRDKVVKKVDMKNGFVAFLTDKNVFMYRNTEL